MSILGKIFGRLLPHANAGQAPGAPAAPAQQAAPQAPTVRQPAAPQSAASAQPAGQPAVASQGAPAAAGAATPQPAMQQPVDIEKSLDALASNSPQKLNWRTSIVDLMKLVGMDSTLQERKELADELGYQGDKGDSAAMNIWLHKAVLRKLQENGGKVPASLLD
jgi:hypothetical protein